MNPIETYAECGRKAGIAAKRKDMSLVRFHQSWCNRAVSLEPTERKAECLAAYRDAYKEEATPTNYFR